MTRDEHYQAFMDWARNASIPIVLEHLAILMRFQVEPNDVIHQTLREVAKQGGWSTVLTLLADVQRERESKAA